MSVVLSLEKLQGKKKKRKKKKYYGGYLKVITIPNTKLKPLVFTPKMVKKAKATMLSQYGFNVAGAKFPHPKENINNINIGL